MIDPTEDLGRATVFHFGPRYRGYIPSRPQTGSLVNDGSLPHILPHFHYSTCSCPWWWWQWWLSRVMVMPKCYRVATSGTVVVVVVTRDDDDDWRFHHVCDADDNYCHWRRVEVVASGRMMTDIVAVVAHYRHHSADPPVH